MSADTVPDTDRDPGAHHPGADWGTVTGWGRTAPTGALVVRPRTYEEAAVAVRDCGVRGGIARGLGRAYGDAAQNAGGAVLDMTALDRVHAVDAAGGTVLCDAGVSLHRLMEVLLPLGWFVPVTPGTRYVTVGGAIGADIHGKNHHVSGSFTRHVLSLELLTADGRVRTVAPGTPLFEATAGGMGLTGVILTATLRLQPVQTALMSVDTERAADLDDLMARLTATDHRYRYSVAWIDLLARGRATGRAVLTRGDHAPLDALPARSRARRAPLAFRTSRLPAAPDLVPDGLLGRTAVGLFNEVWYRKAPRCSRGRLQRISTFFHPLDGVPHWNRVYGRGGFVQYQFVVGARPGGGPAPDRAAHLGPPCPSFLAVPSASARPTRAGVAFARRPGWTLAARHPGGPARGSARSWTSWRGGRGRGRPGLPRQGRPAAPRKLATRPTTTSAGLLRAP
ncbi:FAD-binding oxidoreductase OS=Streptomyces tendae OX=1932 GN=GUR47_16565 PE=4 SV=1 [Streptomyces tendae]